MELKKRGGVRDELDKFQEMRQEADDRKRRRLEELGLPPMAAPPRTDERGLQERGRQEVAQREELMRIAGPVRPAEIEPEEPFPEEEEQTEEATAQDAAPRAVELNVGQFLEFSDEQLGEVFTKGTLRGKRVTVSGLDARKLAGVLLQQRGRLPAARDQLAEEEPAEEAITAQDAGPVREVAWSSQSIRSWLRECDAAGGRGTFRTRVLGLQLAPGQLLAICRVGRRRAAGVDSVIFTQVPGDLVERLRLRPQPVLTRTIVESYLGG